MGNFQLCKKILGRNKSVSRPNETILLDHPKRVFYRGSYLKFFKIKLYQFSWKPSCVSVEFSDPAMFIPLRHDGDDIVLPETEFVVILPLEVENGSGSFPFPARYRGVKLEVSAVALHRVVGLKILCKHNILDWTKKFGDLVIKILNFCRLK